MRIQIIALLLANCLAVEMDLNENGALRASVSIGQAVDQRQINYAAPATRFSNRSRRADLSGRSRRSAGFGANYQEVDGWRVNYLDNPDPNDNKLRPWKMVVTDITDEVDQSIDKKLSEDKKEVKKAENILSKDIELLKNVEDIQNQPLNQQQAQKAANLEEKLIDQINREQNKISNVLVKDKDLKQLKEIGKDVSEVRKAVVIPGDKREGAAGSNEGKLQLLDKLNQALAIELIQNQVAPQLIDSIKTEIRKQQENIKNSSTSAPQSSNLQAKMPEIKEILLTQPLIAAVPLMENIFPVDAANKAAAREQKIAVGSNNS